MQEMKATQKPNERVKQSTSHSRKYLPLLGGRDKDERPWDQSPAPGIAHRKLESVRTGESSQRGRAAAKDPTPEQRKKKHALSLPAALQLLGLPLARPTWKAAENLSLQGPQSGELEEKGQVVSHMVLETWPSGDRSLKNVKLGQA